MKYFVLSFAFLGCARGPQPMQEHRDDARPGKQSAPVRVTASIGNTQADVTVQFERDITDATVRFTGSDGLEITSGATPLTGAIYSGGQAVTLPVTFRIGADAAVLSAFVSGRFDGRERVRVVSFPVGKGRQHAVSEKPEVDSSGARVRVMPATPVP